MSRWFTTRRNSRIALLVGCFLCRSLPAGAETNLPFVVVSSNGTPASVRLPTHVVSVSKQITVFAADQGLAAGLATFADKVKDRLLNKLGMRDTWRAPVLLVVRSQTNAAARAEALIESSVYESDRTLKYQINCVVPPPIHPEQFVSEFVRVLCAEIANRDTPLRSPHLAVPPLWFSEGLAQNLLGDVRDLEIDLVERAMRTPRGAGLKTFVNETQLPPAGMERELYKAKCKLLVRGLLVLPDGMRRAQQFLAGLKPDQDWWPVFETVFVPGMTHTATPDEWWAGQLKLRSAPSPFNRLTAAETDARLVAILTMEAVHHDPKSGRDLVRKVSWMELRDYLDAPGTKEMLADRMRRLENLQLIGQQSYAPAIALYLVALNHVRLDRFRLLPDALQKADAALQTVRNQNQQINDLLDKQEAQQRNRDLLFLYRDYFQTFEEIKSFENSRDNAIKDYLDKVQASETAPKESQ